MLSNLEIGCFYFFGSGDQRLFHKKSLYMFDKTMHSNITTLRERATRRTTNIYCQKMRVSSRIRCLWSIYMVRKAHQETGDKIKIGGHRWPMAILDRYLIVVEPHKNSTPPL